MANLHILVATDSGVNAVAHVAVPAGNNSAGVAWQTAVINSGIGGKTQLPNGDGTGGTISAAELASIQAGQLIEVPILLRPATAPGTIPQYLTSQFAAVSTETLGRLQAQLKFFGAAGG